MTQVETKIQLKKRYTLREVQSISQAYDLLVQPLTSRTYGIFFDGQLVSEANKLVDVVAILPDLYRAIQGQLAENEAEIALRQNPIVPSRLQAKRLADVVAAMPISIPDRDFEACAIASYTSFSHHAYEDATSWEMRDQLNKQGYEDAIAHRLPVHTASCPYMAGYNRGARDRKPLIKS